MNNVAKVLLLEAWFFIGFPLLGSALFFLGLPGVFLYLVLFALWCWELFACLSRQSRWRSTRCLTVAGHTLPRSSKSWLNEQAA